MTMTLRPPWTLGPLALARAGVRAMLPAPEMEKTPTDRSPFRLRTQTDLARLVVISLLSLLVGGSLSTSGCTAVQTIPDESESAWLVLDVEPRSAEVYIDSKYRGVVEGWRGQVVPIEPGYHRVELRAEGRITRRFDVRVGPGEQFKLTVVMELTLDDEI